MSENLKEILIPKESILTRILIIRESKVMIDSDLAELYGVSTKRLNEQVKRNIKRFPKDFMFQLSEPEKEEVVAFCDHLSKLKFSTFSVYNLKHLKHQSSVYLVLEMLSLIKIH